MNCKSCGNEINKKAVVCPNCGCKIKKPFFKKWWFWVIIAVVVIAIGSSAGSDSSGSTFVEKSDSNNSSKVENVENDGIPQIQKGDKIVSKDMEITINSVELTYDVLPDDTSGLYSHYASEKGNVYISVDATVKNTSKQNLPCDEIGLVNADYNNGYKYSGFVIVKDSSTGFTYANITDIAPLETMGIKWLIECPEEVEKSNNPLSLEFNISSDKYKYTIR